MAFFEIPTRATPFSQSVTFPDGTVYNLTFTYLFNENPVWNLDIFDANLNPILCGVPLVTGADLFEQFAYLGFKAQMFATTDGDPDTPPSWFNLGSTAHLYINA